MAKTPCVDDKSNSDSETSSSLSCTDCAGLRVKVQNLEKEMATVRAEKEDLEKHVTELEADLAATESENRHSEDELCKAQAELKRR